MLDISRVRAIGLDLDDTLWPIWPTIARAEVELREWLATRAPGAALTMADPATRLEQRRQVERLHPELAHDMSALRRECIRLALQRAGEDAALAEPAFEVFFEHRMRVDLFADALPALEFLAARFPVVAISNGNADVARVGLAAHFTASLSAHRFGVGKPDARIFHAAAAAVGVLAHEVLHVGDDPALDVLGGLDAGMQTVWVNRSEQPWSHAARPHASVTDLRELCVLLGAPA
jgi:FMN hydrolase / 5-amino-6-(5-phospho-D-ribitylamino)uracil phosphatase